MLYLNRLWLMLGIAATMSSLFAADPIAVWTNFTGLAAASPLAPTFSSTQNGLNGADWRFNLEGATVTADGALQTGVAAPAKITFAASGTPIDVGYNAKPITVLIALKGLSTSTTKGKPFWIATNGRTGIGCALNAYTDTTAQTKGCWGNVLWNGAGSPKDMNGLAGTSTKCLAMVTGNAMIQPSDNKKKYNSAIALVTSETVSWQEMDGLRGTGLTADAIYFGNFRGGTSGGMNYTLVGVAVFNGKATDAELKAMVASLTWQGTTSGTANSGTWNTTTGNNMWKKEYLGDVASAFTDSTPVTFKDIATVTTSTVTVDGTVTPAFTVVGNSATTYTFIGSGTIAGSLITKQGDGAVEIACANSASELRVGGGTVKLNHASALNAAGTLTMAGGTLDLNGTSRTIKTLTGTAGTITSTSAATLTVTDATTYGGNIGGAVSLALAANSSLSGAITGTGTIIVTGGGALKRSGIQPMTVNALPAGGIEFDGTSWVDLYTEAVGTEHTLITVTTAPANWDNVTAINVPPFIDFIKSGTTCKIRIVANKNPELTLMPIGDSITEGNTQTMCYRRDLWEQLTAAGYNIRTVGIRRTTFHDHTQTDEKLKWAWHNAFSGARILPSATREGQRMNLDTELEVCGYPDVITVLIGTNNLSDSSDAFFTMWVDYIDRIATLRPNSQILVSTILRTQGNDAKVESHNAKLRTAWGAGTTKSAPFASHPNVTLVDLHTDVTLDNADFYDNLHPNEKGCAKIAAGWSTAIQLVLNKESGLNGNRILIRAFNAEPIKLSVTFNQPFTATEEATLTAAPMTATLSGSGALPTLSTPVLSADKRSVTFTATATLPTLTALTVTLTNVPAIDSAKNTIVFTALGSGAAKNVPAAFRNGFLHRKTLDIGENDRYHTEAQNYVDGTDAATAVPAVKRVAYYMELQRAGEPVQFVWASMDAFDPNEVKLGVPTKHAASATGMHQAVVNGLQVYGNRGNFANTSATEVKGFIEFTPGGLSGADSAVSGAPAGYGAAYDWNDTLNATGSYGCMQISRILPDGAYAPAEMLFAFNRFTSSGTEDVEIGIGSFNTHMKADSNNLSPGACSLDYMFLSDAGYTKLSPSAYTVRKLEIWVVPAEELTWDSANATGNWNTTELSWGGSEKFTNGSPVKFDKLNGATAATVTVTEAVAPSALTVASNRYTFTGAETGAINAATIDVASGASAIFNAPLNVSGATTVNGTLTAAGATFTGSTTIAANGALTTTGASTFSTTPVVNGTLSVGANTTLPVTLTTTTKSASGTFIQTAGTRTLTLSATAVRNYDVQGGTLTLNGNFGNAGTEGNAPSFTVANGAHLMLSGQDVIGWNQSHNTLVARVAGLLEKTGSHETFSGKMILENGGELKNSSTATPGGIHLHNSAIIEVATGATASITGNSIWVRSGTPSLDVAANARLSVSAPLVFGQNLTKNGAGTAAFSGAITGGYTLMIRGGTVILSGVAKECTHTEVSDATLKTSVAPGNNTLKLQATSTLEPNGAALTLANAVTMEGAVTLNATQAMTLNGAVTTTGAALSVKGAGAVTVASLNVDVTSSLDIAKGTSVTVTAATFASGATLKVRGGTLAVAAITLPSTGTIKLEVPAGVIIPNGGVAILTSTADLPSSAVSKFAVPTGYVLKASTDNKTLELFNAVTIARPDGDPSQFSDDATKQILALVSSSTAVTGVTEVTVKTSHGTAVTTVDTVNAVLGCFEGVASVSVTGTTATVAIVYDFGISALAPTVNEPTSATVTCQVQGVTGATATFADGVIVGLQTTDSTSAPIGDVREMSRTEGTVILTVPLANIKNKAFRAVATKPDPAP